MGKIAAHVQEYVGRYVVVATVVLLPLSGLLGQLAADWGGADSRLGRIVLGAASVLGTAAAVGVWLRNLGLWETAPLVAQAQAEATVAAVSVAALQSGSAVGLESLPMLEDPEADAAPADVSDEEELAAPPPDDDTTTPVAPSELSDAEADDPPRP